MKDGMDLLDLGCGWGSVALHFAQKFKNSRLFIFSHGLFSIFKKLPDVISTEPPWHV